MAMTQCFQMCTLPINLTCITDKHSISHSPLREYYFGYSSYGLAVLLFRYILVTFSFLFSLSLEFASFSPIDDFSLNPCDLA